MAMTCVSRTSGVALTSGSTRVIRFEVIRERQIKPRDE